MRRLCDALFISLVITTPAQLILLLLRYVFEDPDAPIWLREDEKKCYSSAKPVSEQEIQEAAKNFRGVDARSIKKIAEAKARKKRRRLKRLQAVNAQAGKVSCFSLSSSPSLSVFSSFRDHSSSHSMFFFLSACLSLPPLTLKPR